MRLSGGTGNELGKARNPGGPGDGSALAPLPGPLVRPPLLRSLPPAPRGGGGWGCPFRVFGGAVPDSDAVVRAWGLWRGPGMSVALALSPGPYRPPGAAGRGLPTSDGRQGKGGWVGRRGPWPALALSEPPPVRYR